MEVVCLFVAEHDKLIWEPTTVVLKSAVIAIHNKACEILVLDAGKSTLSTFSIQN